MARRTHRGMAARGVVSGAQSFSSERGIRMPITSDTSTNPTRELAAIMFSDIAGYTLIMGRDEQEGLRAVKMHNELLHSVLPKFNGRILGDAGDGILTGFHSAVDAVRCACEMQAALEDNIEFSVRIGVHVGDVVFTDNTVLGDGINVASRIHALAPPGGICISERVYDEIRNQPGLPAKFLGEKILKNVSRPIGVYAMAMPGMALEGGPGAGARRRLPRRRLVLLLVAVAAAVLSYELLYNEVATLARIYVPRMLPPEVNQKIAYCTTSDGVRIAYGTSGKGPPVVIAVGMLTHLKLGLFSPTYNSAFLKPLIARHTVVQYDGRGFGMSDRGLKDYSVEARLRDLEAVVNTLKLNRFALYGISAGCQVAIAYAAKHPERVTRMILYAGDVDNGRDPSLSPDQRQMRDAGTTLVANGWGNAPIRELFASFVMPSASEVEKRFFSEVTGESVTPEDFAAFFASQKSVDVKTFAAQVRVPTLIIQVRDDQMNPLASGKKVADLIPGARFVVIDGTDHIPMPGTRESEQIAQIVVPFLDEDLPDKELPASR
ncbi:MAG TPA: alpha/beta fold hydrolase [Candidatus Binatus sp.]|uniref:alpha/beta fold hydrolase n=1 Tax=Candidatus Binatus sp. TaxID=2811406 RepID=UPI002B479893|nr:alpha/beta fold hydrolase [Candidatus Binatus sp.]HKN12500.1 alpha/beta fold hydrolase [Candidatus Binatus sp.]